MKENIGQRDKFKNQLIKINFVERLSGFDLLSELPNDIEGELESKSIKVIW